jgi:hypothetical protein
VKLLVLRGTLRCGHDGLVSTKASQPWVRVDGSPVLVDNDPQGLSITMCPNISVNFKPCTTTLAVRDGYSTFVRVAGHAACLETVVGFTDGTPPGAVEYRVRQPGQDFVRAVA